MIRQTDKSSGFHPIIVTFFLCLLGGTPLLIWNGQNVLSEILAAAIIALPLLCFVVVYTIKAFTNPNFCRSERHVERMAKAQMEMMGTEKLSVPAQEIEAAKLERPPIEPREVRKLADKNQGNQNG